MRLGITWWASYGGGVFPRVPALLHECVTPDMERLGQSVQEALTWLLVWTYVIRATLVGHEEVVALPRNENRRRVVATAGEEYPLGESNPCLRTENPMSWATRRRGQVVYR